MPIIQIISKVKYPKLLLSLSSILLLSGAWYIHPLLSFFGLAPIFIIEDLINNSAIKRKNRAFLGYVYLIFSCWNVATTWWILNSTIIGALLAFFINALLMCFPFALYRLIKPKLILANIPVKWIIWILIPLWISFEFLHLDWDLSWTWLTLGNCFSFAHYLVQWYAITGVFGGTLWIWVVNILIYKALTNPQSETKSLLQNHRPIIYAFLFPIIFSLLTYFKSSKPTKSIEVVVVQPNIDPYLEKFRGTVNFIPYEEQLNRLLKLSASKLTSETKFLEFPETSLPVGYDEDLMEDQVDIKIIRSFLAKYPHLTIITGADTYKIYLSEYDKTATARFEESVGYYDYFNTALKIENDRKIIKYHKSKLVPGVEQMPFPTIMKFVEKFAINLGGITGTLGKQEERTVFFNKDKIGTAPIICYESIYGNFVAKFVRNGANFISIVTNDGWWGNTAGHVQHLALARLRAIETNREVARAANTGISAFLNAKGDIKQQTEYGKQGVLIDQVNLYEQTTFYTQFGDYIGTFSLAFSLGLILTGIIATFISRKKS
jgi:apolipoprotein N-acyltransferase